MSPFPPIPIPPALAALGHVPGSGRGPQSDSTVEAVATWLQACEFTLVPMPWGPYGVPAIPDGDDQTACAVVSPLETDVRLDKTVAPSGGWTYDGFFWLWTDCKDGEQFRAYIDNLTTDPELPHFPTAKALVSSTVEGVGSGITVGVLSAL